METANLLIIEDDPDINRLLCTILEGAGYTCRAAFPAARACCGRKNTTMTWCCWI